MKIVCIHSSSEKLPEPRRRAIARFIRTDNSMTYLSVGQEYSAYGAIIRDNVPWFYVFEEAYDQYPKPYPVDYFDVKDWQVPTYWFVRSQFLSDGYSSTEILPRKWLDFPMFYERLVDGDMEAVELMQRLKKQQK